MTVSNTTAHLAEALGKPTFVMVPFGNGRMWCWFAGRPKSPWYPSVDVYYQTIRQSWSALVSEVMDDVAQRLADKNFDQKSASST